MANKLIIVESPTKAKTIGKILGKGYRIMATGGHFRDLPKTTLGIDVENGFAPKYLQDAKKKDTVNAIKAAAKEADAVYLASDPDREGEAIAWHLAETLKLDPKAKCRITFHEITPNAVREAVKHPAAVDMNLVNAQQARRILDRLVGYQISPILWKKIARKLSAGRVQSAALHIVCEREQVIKAHVPEEYWLLDVELQPENGKKTFPASYSTKKPQGKLRTEAETDAVLQKIKNQPYVLTRLDSREVTRHAPPPFRTSTLQQEASRKLGFTAARTMQAAQKLFEGIELGKRGSVGLITYMRTDSLRIAGEAQTAALSFIKQKWGDGYIPEKPNRYATGANAQDAHEAIRPTDVGNVPEDIKSFFGGEQDAYKLYKLIYERFLSSQMTGKRVLVTEAGLSCAGIAFETKGEQVLFKGYSVLYTEGSDDAEEKTRTLPPMEKGDRFTAVNTDARQRFTEPPKRYTEASLIAEMESNGIGRPSTYAPTISNIIDHGYVRREKKTLFPTDTGMIVNEWMCRNFSDIVQVEYTKGMEDRLDRIAAGETDYAGMLKDFYGPFRERLAAAEATERVNIPGEGNCEVCGAPLIVKIGRFGKFLACPNYPQCSFTKNIVVKTGVTCPLCKGEIIELTKRNGKPYWRCENRDCPTVLWDKPTGALCPKCGKMLVTKFGKTGAYTACSDRDCGYRSFGKKANADKQNKDGKAGE